MIYIYSHKKTARLKYTLHVVFKIILQVDFRLVDQETFVNENSVPKINYSDEDIDADIWINPHTLLFEKVIHPQEIRVTYHDEIPFFFKTSDIGKYKFDIFACSFFMLSRYEEYLPFVADKHGRFTAKESVAFKTNFLQKPVVHLWANELREDIRKIYPNYLFPTRIFTQVNTIDIDIAYAYMGKSITRRFGGLIKSLLQFNIHDIFQRISYLFSRKDPYDTYKTLRRIQKKLNLENIYFFQVGNQGPYDKNLSLNRKMNKLISKVSKYAEIGIHPSYNSNSHVDILRDERLDLMKIAGNPITKSRQHYLKMRLPKTYENLIKVGIEADYTMGFPDQIGFRAGIALPYPFFNIQTNTQRPLTIVPFQIMDGTLKDYMKLSPDEAIQKVRMLKETIKDGNGQLVSIFHNSSVTNLGEMKGWLDVYKAILE